MTSVAVQAERLASSTAAPPTPTPTTATSNAPAAPPTAALTVPGGHYENGRVYLKGNTLKVVKDIFCHHCKLPRLLYPVTGAGAKIPKDPNGTYCNLHPFIRKSGHDIYGNPFPIDQTNKTKRERELIKKQEKADRDGTPGSQDTNDDSVNGELFVRRMLAGGKPASYVPWHTCPLCKRSLLITKFAQHLEKCLGIGGRAARNTAAARLSGMNGSASGSVQGGGGGSRMGTPTPSSQGGRRDPDPEASEEDAETFLPPKKKVKKDGGSHTNGTTMSKKEKKRERAEAKERLVIKVKDAAAAAKRLPKTNKDVTSNPEKGANGEKNGNDTPSRKREREKDADGEGERPKGRDKKVKLGREGSSIESS